MSLSDRLQSAAEDSKIRLCKIGLLLAGTSLSEKDKQHLNDVFAIKEGTAGRVTNVALAKIFREEGYDISLSTVDRHRNQSCGCFNMAAGN